MEDNETIEQVKLCKFCGLNCSRSHHCKASLVFQKGYDEGYAQALVDKLVSE
jgi:hypothetical protein